MNIHPIFRGDSPRGNVVFNFLADPVADLAPFAHGYHDAKIDTQKLFCCHKLTTFLAPLKVVCDALHWTDEFQTEGVTCWKDFEDIVQGIEEVDPNSERFRYPVDSKGQGALPNHTVLNVIAFAARLDPIIQLLAGGITGMQEEFDASAEARHEVERLLKEISEQEH